MFFIRRFRSNVRLKLVRVRSRFSVLVLSISMLNRNSRLYGSVFLITMLCSSRYFVTMLVGILKSFMVSFFFIFGVSRVILIGLRYMCSLSMFLKSC